MVVHVVGVGIMKRDEEDLVAGVLKLGWQGAGGRDHRRSLLRVDAKVQVAVALLHQATVYEIAGTTELANQIWPSVHRRWHELDESDAFRDWIAERAEASCGKERGREVAPRVAAAFTRRVLPRIHGAIAISTSSSDQATFHELQIKELARKYGAPEIDPDSLAVCELNWTRFIRTLHAPVPGSPHLMLYTRALESTEPARDRHALADEIAGLVTALVGKTERGDAFERLAKTVPDHFGLRRVYAREVLLSGKREVRARRYAAAARFYLWARELDPLLEAEVATAVADCAASVQGQATGGAGEPAEPDPYAIWGQRGQRSRRPRKDPRAQYFEFEKALVFPETAEAKALRSATGFAIYSTLLFRLGLDPENPEHVQAAERLLATVSGDESLSKAALIAQFPVLRDVPWAELERLSGASAVQLAIELPALDRLPDYTPSETRLRAYYGQLTNELRDMPPTRARRSLALDWLASTVDVMPKLAALAGLVMLVVGLTVFAVHGHAAARRDSDYARFRAAVAAKDAPRAIDAARDFLDVTTDSTSDYRSQDVADEYSRVLLVEMRKAATANDSTRLATLAGDARALRSWYSTNDANLDKKLVAR